VKKSKKTIADGEIIFREGESSDSAFEIVAGNVEITKSGGGGDVRLALLGPGEMFGEMGILDRGRRSATARAVGPVSVNVISHKDFLAGVRDKPDLALSVMGKLVERLRVADDMLAGGAKQARGAVAGAGAGAGGQAGGPEQLPSSVGSDGGGKEGEPGLVSKLFGWKGLAKPERIQVLVAPLFGADGDKHAKRIQQALEKRKGLAVKALKKPLKVETVPHPDEQIAAVVAAARRVLADAEADLLIWGEALAPGLSMQLRFVSFAGWSDDTPGGFLPATTLPLPVELDDKFADLLHAVALAATVPKSEAKAAAAARDLPLALDSARAALDPMPRDLTRRERGEVRFCFANALATLAQQRGEPGLYQSAAAAYKESLGGLSAEDTPFEWAMANKYMGSTLQALAERTNSKPKLGEAADALRAALKALSKDRHPWEWAATQNRLGQVLYKLDFDGADIDMLKHAIGAYQAALQVFTRADAPLRWAEVMNNFAQVTQVLGEQLKNPEALEKAVEACRAALEVRTKTKTPLLWATTQNNLGSALFLLGKMTRNVQHLQGAAEAFDLAGGVYKARGMSRMAAVTDKNLSHVNQLLEQSQPKGVPKMRWEGIGSDDAEGGT
jgi:tetratricopeptide (TPR) repeat protein